MQTRSASGNTITTLFKEDKDLSNEGNIPRLSDLTSTIEVSPVLSEIGIYPCIDPFLSSNLDPKLVGDRHYKIVKQLYDLFDEYEGLKDIVA